ncbi:beta-1,3-galactosyltransferase 1-like [Babylonia areolata]|uniref:beta-1,3-galactosyltransferase 1-like n=1 Tax=Babylonia areolata TaxID=304850 RepID=UPI003FD51497
MSVGRLSYACCHGCNRVKRWVVVVVVVVGLALAGVVLRGDVMLRGTPHPVFTHQASGGGPPRSADHPVSIINRGPSSSDPDPFSQRRVSSATPGFPEHVHVSLVDSSSRSAPVLTPNVTASTTRAVTSLVAGSVGPGHGAAGKEARDRQAHLHHHHHHQQQHQHQHHNSSSLFVLNEPDACSDDTELVAVVVTAPNNTEDRQAVRETWGSYRDDPGHHVALVFLVGAVPQDDPALQARLEAESAWHGDLVQGDFRDSYRNLTLKSLALLRWVALHCGGARYVLKADDDVYVNLTNLLTELRRQGPLNDRDNFVLGHVAVGARPLRDRTSKWYTPVEDFNETVYPPYVSGTAYAMTASAARKLYSASAAVPFFWLEDVYITGLCSRHAGVPVQHSWDFSYTKRGVDGCHFRAAISAHGYSAQEKRDIFRQVNDVNLRCRRVILEDVDSAVSSLSLPFSLSLCVCMCVCVFLCVRICVCLRVRVRLCVCRGQVDHQ